MKYTNVYINCSYNLMLFQSNNEAQEFFLYCIYGSEGAERDRYTNIYLDLKSGNRFISDGSEFITSSRINFTDIPYNDLIHIKKIYNLDDNEIYSFMADEELKKVGKRIYSFDFKNDSNGNFLDFYNNQKYSKTDKFYMFSDDKTIITCFDVYDSELYYIEDFDMKDYQMAFKWLNNEIEYDEYLEYKNKEEDACL